MCRICFIETGIPEERRGGDHRSKKSEAKLAKIQEFIESLQPIESHYCRGKSKRQYLPSHLSIRILWRCYNAQEENPNLKAPYDYFRQVFVKYYNVGFGSPATDQCSKCMELKERIKNTRDQAKKRELNVTLEIHKKRAKKFFELLKVEENNEMTFSFDCQKNLIFPKLTDQTAYFLRQFYVYNFTMCKGPSKDSQSKENTFIYTWKEFDASKGSSEIASCVHHRLSNTEYPSHIDTIRLFCDGAGGQNKNSILITALLNWLLKVAPQQIKSVILFYPTPGHSYIPPDRVFGVIEKKIRKMETIEHPATYVDVFKESGTVIEVTEDFLVRDWKSISETAVKKPAKWPFKFNPCKRFILTKGQRNQGCVQGEIAYSFEMNRPCSIAAPKFQIMNIQPVVKPKGVPINPKKVNDVKKLLEKHYGPEWQELETLKFYKDLFEEPTEEGNIADEEEVDEPMEDDILIMENTFVL